MSLERIRLADMVRAGARATSQYTGTVFAVFAIQFVAAWSAGLVVLLQLDGAFADKPLFDDAVDGDLVALLTILRAAPDVIASIVWVVIGAVAMWSAWSWYLTGGVLAVFTERPLGRADTARCFGAGGAATFFVFARLAVLSTVLQLPAILALLVGVGYLSDRIATAVEVSELYGPLLLGLGPAIVLHVVASTITDYARAELTLRRPTNGNLGAVWAVVRAAGYLARRPVALAHVGAYWLAVIAVWLVFVWLTHDHPMYGTGGALALFAIRQIATLVRTALKLGLLAGQVELTATRPPPPRTVSRPAAT
jgi:hypothetical protein